MRPVYGVRNLLQDQQYIFGARSLFMAKKVFLTRSDQPAVLFRRLM